jgi:hypothetical protein
MLKLTTVVASPISYTNDCGLTNSYHVLPTMAWVGHHGGCSYTELGKMTS